MAGDYQGINPAGDPLSREDLLGAVNAGVLDFLVAGPASPISVRLFGNAAVLRYQRNFDLVVAGTRLTHKAWTPSSTSAATGIGRSCGSRRQPSRTSPTSSWSP